MIVPIVRNEEDLEDLYIDDFFWMHERGVDLIFIFLSLKNLITQSSKAAINCLIRSSISK